MTLSLPVFVKRKAGQEKAQIENYENPLLLVLKHIHVEVIQKCFTTKSFFTKIKELKRNATGKKKIKSKVVLS